MVAIRFVKIWSQKYDKFSASFTDQEVNYVIVTMAIKSCENRMQSCAIEMRQRLFRCSHRNLVSESRGAPFEFGRQKDQQPLANISFGRHFQSETCGLPQESDQK